jgi:hypothetical protein
MIHVSISQASTRSFTGFQIGGMDRNVKRISPPSAFENIWLEPARPQTAATVAEQYLDLQVAKLRVKG